MFQIRQARLEDIPAIQKFIADNWKENHIMAVSREMFDFQHVYDNEVKYIIAEETDTGEILASMGYMPINTNERPAVSTTMICAPANDEHPLLGNELHTFFWKNIKCFNEISVGVAKKYAYAIARWYGDEKKHVSVLKHFFRLNTQMEQWIATGTRYQHQKGYGEAPTLRLLKSKEDFRQWMSLDDLQRTHPYRTEDVLIRRYYEHPFYHYCVYGVCSNDDALSHSIIVLRVIEVEGHYTLRVIDYVGADENLIGLASSWDLLMQEYHAEYIDFYCYGIDKQILEQSGFCDKEDTDYIIPDHFEPFERKNIEIFFCCRREIKKPHVYKGFGDQDRPSQIPNIKNE